MSEELLGDGPTRASEDVLLAGGSADVTLEVEPEDFDFDAFVSGVRQGRRAVKIVARADLMAQRDRLVHQVMALKDDGSDDELAAELEAQFREVTTQIRDSSREFVLEARSDKRLDVIIKSAGVEPGKKATEDERKAYQEEVALLRLLDAIVVPSKVTREGLERLREAAPAEYVKLWNVHVETITNPTRGLGVDPNFSLGR